MDQIELANLFSWAMTNPPNWVQGVLYVVLGVIGALVTIYFAIGGTIPTPSGAKLEIEFKELVKKNRELAELREKALADPASINPSLIDAFSNDTDKQRDDLEKKRKAMFRSWALLYVLLGAFFAAMLAQDLLQAIAIGAGWTSFLAVIGLSRDNQEIKSEVAGDAEIVEQAVKELENKLDQLKENKEILQENVNQSPSWDYKDTVKTAEKGIRQIKMRSLR